MINSLYIEWPEWVNPPAIHFNQHRQQWYVFLSTRIGRPNVDQWGLPTRQQNASAWHNNPELAMSEALAFLERLQAKTLAEANSLPAPMDRARPKGITPAKVDSQAQELFDLLNL